MFISFLLKIIYKITDTIAVKKKRYNNYLLKTKQANWLFWAVSSGLLFVEHMVFYNKSPEMRNYYGSSVVTSAW